MNESKKRSLERWRLWAMKGAINPDSCGVASALIGGTLVHFDTLTGKTLKGYDRKRATEHDYL